MPLGWMICSFSQEHTSHWSLMFYCLLTKYQFSWEAPHMIAKLRPPHSNQRLYGYLQHLHCFWDYVYLTSLFYVPSRHIWVPDKQGLYLFFPRNCTWLILITTVLYFIYVSVLGRSWGMSAHMLWHTCWGQRITIGFGSYLYHVDPKD